MELEGAVTVAVLSSPFGIMKFFGGGGGGKVFWFVFRATHVCGCGHAGCGTRRKGGG